MNSSQPISQMMYKQMTYLGYAEFLRLRLPILYHKKAIYLPTIISLQREFNKPSEFITKCSPEIVSNSHFQLMKKETMNLNQHFLTLTGLLGQGIVKVFEITALQKLSRSSIRVTVS